MSLSIDATGEAATERLTVEEDHDEGWGILITHTGSGRYEASVLVPFATPLDEELYEAAQAQVGSFPTQAQAMCALVIRLLALLAIVAPTRGVCRGG